MEPRLSEAMIGVRDWRDHASFFLNLSRLCQDEVVPYRAQGQPAFLINRPEHAVHVLSTARERYANPYHPYAELAGLYRPEGTYLLRLGHHAEHRSAYVHWLGQLVHSGHELFHVLAERCDIPCFNAPLVARKRSEAPDSDRLRDVETLFAAPADGVRLKIVHARFFDNTCEDTGPDVGGAAVRARNQSQGKPVYVINSTFGGRDDLGNVGSNGGGLSAIGVSYDVRNSVFSYNRAIGYGANPMRAGTPGGGSGGAIYNDGNTFTLNVCGTRIEHNHAREGGGAIFFVSNDSTGSLVIQDSSLRDNPSDGFETDGYPGIFVLDDDDKPKVSNSTIQ